MGLFSSRKDPEVTALRAELRESQRADLRRLRAELARGAGTAGGAG